MTKEAFKQHKDTLHWWSQSESRTVWVIGCSLIGDWKLDRNPNWYSDQIIVPNDQFADQRKAGAEGKQLQVSYDDGLHWYDKLTHKIKWSGCLVRVKPVTIFKKGDWVKSEEFGLIQLTCDNFDSYNRRPQDVHRKGSGVYTELWHPAEDEWCIFYQSHYKHTFKVAKFTEQLGRKYSHVEPYQGQIPSNFGDES